MRKALDRVATIAIVLFLLIAMWRGEFEEATFWLLFLAMFYTLKIGSEIVKILLGCIEEGGDGDDMRV